MVEGCPKTVLRAIQLIDLKETLSNVQITEVRMLSENTNNLEFTLQEKWNV